MAVWRRNLWYCSSSSDCIRTNQLSRNSDSLLPEWGQSCVHALAKSARSQEQHKWKDRVLISNPFAGESQESSVMGAIWMWKNMSFRSSEKNQSYGNICERICIRVNAKISLDGLSLPVWRIHKGMRMERKVRCDCSFELKNIVLFVTNIQWKS